MKRLHVHVLLKTCAIDRVLFDIVRRRADRREGRLRQIDPEDPCINFAISARHILQLGAGTEETPLGVATPHRPRSRFRSV